MKKKLMNNLGLKILALLFSVVLWLLVMNMENPLAEETFSRVPVTVVNEQIVTNKGKTFQIEDRYQYVSVTVRAKRSILQDISADNIEAVMDFQNPGELDTYRVSATVTGVDSSDVEIVEISPGAIPVTIDDTSNETFAITPMATGTVQDGYVLDRLTATPSSVVISGPATVVNSIDRVVAEVDVNGLSAETDRKAELILYDENNNQVDPTRLSFNIGDDGVMVNITLMETKDVELQFDTSAIGTADGYYFAGISARPSTVTIVGPEDELEAIDSIEIPASELTYSELTERVREEVDITPYLPEDVELAEESGGVVVVEIEVELYGSRTYEVPYGSIYLMNVPDGLTASYDSAGVLEVRVSGPEDELESLVLDQRNVSVNLVTYTTPGEYMVPVQVNLSEGCSLVSENLSIQITLEEQE